jgi:uncharacterized coiled-coil DUF342 family protein
MDTNEKQIALSVLESLRSDLMYAHLKNGSHILDVADLRPPKRCIIRGAMDAAKKVDELLQQLAEVLLTTDKDIAEMKVSIAALKAISASQLRPDDPKAGMQYIESLEVEARKHDPTAEQHRKLADVIDAAKLIRKHGYHET